MEQRVATLIFGGGQFLLDRCAIAKQLMAAMGALAEMAAPVGPARRADGAGTSG
jgi:hypothetical protein